MAMTKNQFAPLLLATSLAFSTASQASDDSKTYTVNNFLAPHTYFQASDKKSVFQAASEIIAERTKAGLITIDKYRATGEDNWDVDFIKDDQNALIGRCKLKIYEPLGIKMPFQTPKTHVKAICNDAKTPSKDTEGVTHFELEYKF